MKPAILLVKSRLCDEGEEPLGFPTEFARKVARLLDAGGTMSKPDSPKMLTRDLLLKRRAKRVKVVRIPADFPDSELAGAEFRVQQMSAGERGAFDTLFIDRKTGKQRPDRVAEVRERLVIATVVDNQGNKIFSPEDLPSLKEVDCGLIDLLVKASQELNDISDADIEDLAKN